jgi:hypothetical protein
MLGPLFAREGATIVGSLKHKLEQAENDETILYTIFIFGDMKRMNSYSVSADEALMNVISDSVQRMEDERRKRSAERELEELRG